MFAIALIDKKLNKLFLYRDQSGQKPIYYGYMVILLYLAQKSNQF